MAIEMRDSARKGILLVILALVSGITGIVLVIATWLDIVRRRADAG